jgi:hypothetical protein
MEIKINTNVDSIGRVQSSQAKKSEPKVQSGEMGFERSQALTQSLQDSPDVRVAMVEKAKETTALSNYPPKEIIKKIAALLVANQIQD